MKPWKIIAVLLLGGFVLLAWILNTLFRQVDSPDDN